MVFEADDALPLDCIEHGELVLGRSKHTLESLDMDIVVETASERRPCLGECRVPVKLLLEEIARGRVERGDVAVVTALLDAMYILLQEIEQRVGRWRRAASTA